MKRLVPALIFLIAGSVYAQSATRTYSGGFSSRWKTIGAHGHDQPLCEPIRVTYFNGGRVIGFDYPNCNHRDFSRGNLDNSIGFRVGRERDYLGYGPLKFVGGAEGSASYTEYNTTQFDFAIVSGTLNGGIDLAAFGARLGARIGGGPYMTSDGAERGFELYHEFSASMPFRTGASLRFSRRTSRTNNAHLRANETAIMLVGNPTGDFDSKWELGSWTGATNPGFGPGKSRELRQTVFHRLAVFRDIPLRDSQIQVAWTTTAHESKIPTEFLGYQGNYRSKTINGFGVGLRRQANWLSPLTVHYGGGFEIADWRDNHELLKGGNLATQKGGVEMALTANAGVQFHMARHLALELTAEHAYWRAIDVGELRWGFGIVLTK